MTLILSLCGILVRVKVCHRRRGSRQVARTVSCVSFLEMCETMGCFGSVKNSVEKVGQFQQKLLASFDCQPRKHPWRSTLIHLTDL